MTESRPRDLPPALWLWFPPLMILLQFLALAVGKELHDTFFTGELKAVELGTVLVYLPGLAAGILAFRLRHRLQDQRLGLWILVFILGCAYIAGEEASWGQHIFQWQSPELFQEINKQHETNLHNSTSWLNQKPRIAMELWIVVGGIIMPLRALLKKTSYATADWRYWVWPTSVCLPAALLCFFIKLPLHVEKWFGLEQPLFTGFNLNETHEYNIAVFLTLYLCSIYVRLKQLPEKT